MRQSGINMEQVKAYNRAMIIQYICEHKTASRVDIAAECGLTPAAVTQIISPLIRDGIIIEVGTTGRQKGAGRRKVLLSMNYENLFLYSINIERINTFITLTDINGDVVSSEKLPTDNKIEPEAFLGKVADSCRKLSEKVKSSIKDKIKGISVGIPGIVDIDKGISVKAYGIWDRPVEVCSFLGKELGLPVIIQNDVKAFARAELLLGDGRYNDNFIAVKWGQDISSAITINGNMYENMELKPAEIAHMIVDLDGDECSCGKRGCLESVASYQKLNSIIPFDIENFESVFEKADNEQKMKIEKAIHLFAVAITNCCAIGSPEKIILNGPMFRSKSAREKLIESIGKLDASFDTKRIIHSKLADSEEYIGPIAEFLQRAVFGIKI